MCSTSLIRLWFVCKPCNITVQNLTDFVEHKKEKHLQELLQNKCIVFEESAPETETGASKSDQGYEGIHVLTVQVNNDNTTTSSEVCIENIPSEHISNSQLIIKNESQSNFYDPDRNDEPAAVKNNKLGLNANPHFELLQHSDSKQNPNDNLRKDVKPNPDEDLININSELKYPVYEIENDETQSENISIKKPKPKSTHNPYVCLKRLVTQQEIENTSSPVLVKVHRKYRRPRKMCSICTKFFADTSSLRRHFEGIHKLPLPIPNTSFLPKHLACKVCGKKFHDSSVVRRHVRNLHKTESLEHRRQQSKLKSNYKVCTICHRPYSNIYTLKRHIQLKHVNNDDKLANLTEKGIQG